MSTANVAQKVIELRRRRAKEKDVQEEREKREMKDAILL